MTQIPEVDIHEAGALHLTGENIQQLVEGTEKHRPIVVYRCHSNSSRQGIAFLLQQGFATVFSMSGGFEAWRLAYQIERNAQ